MHPALMAYDLEVIARECAGESDRPPLLFVHGAGHGAWCWAEHFLDFFASTASTRTRACAATRERRCERLRWTSIADYVSDVEQVAACLPREGARRALPRRPGGAEVPRGARGARRGAARAAAGAGPRPGRAHVPGSSVAVAAGDAQRAQAVRNELVRKFFFSPELGEEQVRDTRPAMGPESFRPARAGLHAAGPRAHPRRPAAGARRGSRLLHPALGSGARPRRTTPKCL